MKKSTKHVDDLNQRLSHLPITTNTLALVSCVLPNGLSELSPSFSAVQDQGAIRAQLHPLVSGGNLSLLLSVQETAAVFLSRIHVAILIVVQELAQRCARSSQRLPDSRWVSGVLPAVPTVVCCLR